MAQLFIAKALDSLLQTWEDMNLTGEMKFQIDQLLKKTNRPLPPDLTEKEDLSALVGSEINVMGNISRSITDYGTLRSVLSGKSYTHPTHFLPRIPKELRQEINDPQQFIFHQFVRSHARIPLYLQKWNETRRACIVEDSIPIPTIDLREENWFGYMPYHAFYLSIKSPFVLEIQDESTYTIENFLLYDEGEFVRVMFWATENEQFHLDNETRRGVLKTIEEMKKGKVSSRYQEFTKISNYTLMMETLITDLSIKKNGDGYMDYVGKECLPAYRSLYDSYEGSTDPVELNAMKKVRAAIEMLNGFCKLTTMLYCEQPKVSTRPHISIPENLHPRQWMELPIQTINYFHTDKENENIIIRNGSGNEKSPHYRRGHYRRYIQSDGTEKKVWVEETLVREDKLTTQQLQGGAMKIQ